MVTKTDDQQRAAFEAWYMSKHKKLPTCPAEWAFLKSENGRYVNQLTQTWFEIYQAALASPEVQALRDVLERCHLALEPYDDVKPRDWKSDRENLRYAHQAVCAALAVTENQK